MVFAAGLGNHLTIVGLLPAALIYGIAKDRSVLRPRVLGVCALIGAIGVAQYGFIALRTIQGAPYLEARATTIRGVYDVIIARDVSWARFYQAADKVVGIEVPMLLEGLRVHMGTVTVVLVVIGIGIAAWRRNWEALLVAGGAAGTLGMIANLWGDVVGFITPVIVLLWTLAAYGLEWYTLLLEVRPPLGFGGSKPVSPWQRWRCRSGTCLRSTRNWRRSWLPAMARPCARSTVACLRTAPSLRTTTSWRAFSTIWTTRTSTNPTRVRGC